ncbi:hypothetical protein DPEC_G00111430 [Dallia pectoralis]|uniref:Uncharacterized protein n=1 Tax=Dallia pectoralis TaxID=75939 RepID=A0ACC2GTB3_DALPE|nr:hypothetical protein DPEC_G00111430 [Dallia pectoralis]
MCNKMSNVRLSNGSPTLERVDPGLTDHTKPSICRNLFGTGDPEERKRECSLQIKEMANRFCDKYNYDFIKDEPLPGGTYIWEPVESPAEFYTRPLHKRVCPTDSDNNQATKRPLHPEEPDSPTKRLRSSEEVDVVSNLMQQTPCKTIPEH